jgi:hypothetical protein
MILAAFWQKALESMKKVGVPPSFCRFLFYDPDSGSQVSTGARHGREVACRRRDLEQIQLFLGHSSLNLPRDCAKLQ